MEGFAVIAEYLGDEDGYDTISNFQGPFSLHTVMARALRMPSNRLRVRTAPNSGGAFGVKLVLYVSIVLMCVAVAGSRTAGQMDRGSPRAPGRGQLDGEPYLQGRGRLCRGRGGAGDPLPSLGRSWRLFARTDAGAHDPRACLLHRRLRHSRGAGNESMSSRPTRPRRARCAALGRRTFTSRSNGSCIRSRSSSARIRSR